MNGITITSLSPTKWLVCSACLLGDNIIYIVAVQPVRCINIGVAICYPCAVASYMLDRATIVKPFEVGLHNHYVVR